MFGGGFDLGEDDSPEAEAGFSELAAVCALVVLAVAAGSCLHVGGYTAATGDFVFSHLYMYALMCGGGYGSTYYAARWIERNMAHVPVLALMLTGFAVAVVKAAEFVMLWIWAGSEHALEWLALLTSDPLGWFFTGHAIR